MYEKHRRGESVIDRLYEAWQINVEGTHLIQNDEVHLANLGYYEGETTLCEMLNELVALDHVHTVTRSRLPDALEERELYWQRLRFVRDCRNDFHQFRDLGPVTKTEKELLKIYERKIFLESRQFLKKEQQQLKMSAENARHQRNSELHDFCRLRKTVKQNKISSSYLFATFQS